MKDTGQILKKLGENYGLEMALDENGGNTLKRLEYDASRGRYFLQAESSNPENRNLYPAEISIQGVTKYVIKQV